MSSTNSPNIPTARVGNAAGKSTRERMLMTALRLYAEEGLDRVTLRKISVESGCSNTAAAQYHFRNRDGLIMAIAAFLEEAVWQPGRERLRTRYQRASWFARHYYVGPVAIPTRGVRT